MVAYMNIEKSLKKAFHNSKDLIIHNIKGIKIVYLQSICDANRVNDYVLKNIGLVNKIFKVEDVLAGPNLKRINIQDINNYLYNVFTIIISKNIYAIETKANLIRAIEKPTVETDIYGPKDSFNEYIQNNLGLIKRRIKTSNLINDDYIVGRITKTKVSILYIMGITDEDLVNKVESKIVNLDIDGNITI